MTNNSNIFGSALRGGLSLLGKRKLPQISGKLAVKGLLSPVEVLRDRWGVPHIYAQNDHDLFFAQGFVHAQERFWQMELNRRTAKGTLSEIFGNIALGTDCAARTFGFARLGLEDWKNMPEDVRGILQAYADGINASLNCFPGKLPLEFTLLRHTPAPWTVEDTLAFSRLMFWQLSHAWYSEIVRAKLVSAVGAERASELEMFYPSSNPFTLADGIEFNQLSPEGDLKAVRGPFLDRGKGSNVWAISGKRTETGAAMLCNDMHLVLSIPNIWIENHLISDHYNVTGVSIPAAPLVLAGHNERIAWGITLAFTDAEDLFIEKFNPISPTQYECNGAWRDAQVIEEKIAVKGQKEPHIERVFVTRHGPIISSAVGVTTQRLAVQSMALRPCPALQGWSILNRARGWDDFVDGMKKIEAPQLNIGYADVEGNIGYWVTGNTPIRAKGDGTLPVEGWSGEYEWTGEIPFEEMPHALNPAKGYLVNCNNRPVPEDYPYFLGNAFMNGYRARRLSEMIESQPKISAADCQKMQVDFTCLPGLEFVHLLEGFTSEDADVNLALEHLRSWDGNLTASSVPGAIYEVARYTLVVNLVQSTLGDEAMTGLMGGGFNPVLFPDSELYGNDTPVLFRILQNPASWWLEQAGGRQALLEKSLKQSLEWLRLKYGPDPAGWEWGKFHHITFTHPLSVQKPLAQVFDRGPFPLGGDTDTPWQSAMAPNDPYENKLWAPSMRHIFDMGDISRSQFVLPIGQSGQLGSPHYDDMIERWLTGTLCPMLWTRDQVEQSLEGHLDLSPFN